MHQDYQSTALTVQPTQIQTKILQATFVADKQLERGGHDFTKADLIAIVLNLQPTLVPHVDEVGSLSCNDLRAKIRSIVFDPVKLLAQAQGQAQAQSQAQTNNQDIVVNSQALVTIPKKVADPTVSSAISLVFA